MSILTRFESNQIQAMLRTSNYWSTFNRNDYPVKIQAAVGALYRWIDCPCNDDCDCKTLGCTHHLARDNEVGFDAHYDHFLDCYLDSRTHESVFNGRTSGRGANAVIATEIFRSSWDEIQEDLRENPSASLLCSAWHSGRLAAIAEGFRPSGDNIYVAKWLSLLSMGIYVAYDNGSVKLLNRDFQNPSTYLALTNSLREDLILHLNANHMTIDAFLTIDGPGEFYDGIPHPSRRPLGNILDKLYLVL